MSPDRFPEAFERYETKEDLDSRGIKTFDELLVSFAMWGRSKAPLTRKQTKALAVEAKERGIKGIKVAEVYTQKGVIKTRTRDPITGKFAPRGESKIVRQPPDTLVIKISDNLSSFRQQGKIVYRDARGRYAKAPK